MINLSSIELKVIGKNRVIKYYEYKSEDDLTKMLVNQSQK